MHRCAVVLLLYSGCAFGLSGPDQNQPRWKVPQCDTGKGLVALDGVMAATSGVVALSLAGESEPALALLPVAIGTIYLAGAIRGNSNVNKCRKAIGEYESYAVSRDTMRAIENDDQRPAQERPPITARVDQPAPPATTGPAPVAPASGPMPAPAVAPAPAPRGAAKPPPVPAAPDDDWSEFWREVD